MGIYIFRSNVDEDVIKMGHFKGDNAWGRVVKRGFKTCVRPESIGDRCFMDDLELMAWFPTLTIADEQKAHRIFRKHRIHGEWLKYKALEIIIDYLEELSGYENKADSCDKKEVIKVKPPPSIYLQFNLVPKAI